MGIYRLLSVIVHLIVGISISSGTDETDGFNCKVTVKIVCFMFSEIWPDVFLITQKTP